jgi:hypothetical protein
MAPVGVHLHGIARFLNAAYKSGEVVLQSRLTPGDDDSVKKALALPDKIKKTVLIQEGIAGVLDEVRIVTVGATEIAS